MDKPNNIPQTLRQNDATMISYYESLTSKISLPKNVTEIFHLIKTGNGFKNIITTLRSESNKKKADSLKKNFPQ